MAPAGVVLGMAIGLVFVGGSYWFSDKLAIRSARAVEVTAEQMPQYHAIVGDLAQRADMPMPRLYVAPDHQPNAFATGRSPKHAAVCVNEGILDVLSWEELQGVLAHEISHVRNRDILISSVAAAVAMGITFLARMAMWGAMFGGAGAATATTTSSAPWRWRSWRPSPPRSSRWRSAGAGSTRRTDAAPAPRRRGTPGPGPGEARPGHDRAQQVDPAQASAYIVNPFAGQRSQLAKFTATHPPMEDRIRRLRSGEWQDWTSGARVEHRTFPTDPGRRGSRPPTTC